ncbi:MAG: sigma-70 family RNA polymerase sigma factor [Pseudoxanthomonas sp.]
MVQALYRDHHGWLLGWLRRRMSADEAAADLAQDTFLRVLQKPQLPELQEPRAYLTRIADGLVLNLWQRRALERAYLEVLTSLPEPQAPSEEQRRIALDALIRIDRLLDGLPGRVREAFLLAQLDGLKQANIARRMNVDVRTVKRWMVKAIATCLQGLD